MARYGSGKKFSSGQLVVWVERDYNAGYANCRMILHEGILANAHGSFLHAMTSSGEVKYVSRNDLYHDSPEARRYLQACMAQTQEQNIANDAAYKASNAAFEAAMKPFRPRLVQLSDEIKQAQEELPKEDGGTK